MGLFQELQRRKVIRTVVAYGAAAFVAAQATQLLMDALGLPPWMLRAVVITAIVLLPFVIGLAWAFDASREGVTVSAEGVAGAVRRFRWRSVGIPIAASLTLLLGAFLLLKETGSQSLDQNLVAVLPFHVSGDPQIAFLHEGMIDLLAAKLTGEGGPRAADPRGVLSVVREEAGDDADLSDKLALQIARTVGTGQVLLGSVVGTPAQFTMHARLLGVPGGRLIVEAEQAGTADSLLQTVDKLVAKLLSLQAGEGPQRLDQLMTTSLPALRAYLDGRVAYRTGHFGRASELFGKAIDLDSTFALAAIGQFMTAGWGEGRADRLKARRTLIANRDRLGQVDRALAVAMWGEDPQQPRSWKTRIADWDRAVTLAPDQLDARFWYADFVFHWGGTVDMDDATTRADDLFKAVLRADPTYVPALLHRIDGAIRLDRTDVIRELEPLRKQLDPDETAAHYQRSRRIRLLEDSAAIAGERAALDTMSIDALRHAAAAGGTVPGSVADAMRAVDLRLKKAATRAEQVDALWDGIDRAFMWGMPGRAERLSVALLDLGESNVNMMRVMAALYWDGDQRAAAGAARQLAAEANDKAKLRDRVYGLCISEQWRLWRNEGSTYAQTVRALREVPADSARLKILADVCAETLTVIRAVVQRSPELPRLVQAFNETMREGPAVEPFLLNASNIVLARAAEQVGDRRLAQRAYGRYPGGDLFTLELASAMMREQARLAALNGERALAVRLYRKYLLLHELSEPALKNVDNAARRELARLTGERAN